MQGVYSKQHPCKAVHGFASPCLFQFTERYCVLYLHFLAPLTVFRGSLRHMANAAFLLMVYSKQLDGYLRAKAICFAHGQIRYALGDAGRSFVVGYGTNPPQRVHHRAASCPNPPETCDYRYFTLPGPNPRTIYGALVGGPDPSDIYRDDRTDAMGNEVAVDYNAGFTGVHCCSTSLGFSRRVLWC